MRESPSTDDGSVPRRSNDSEPARPTREPLEAVVVTDGNRPARRTIYPAGSTNEITRTAWLTANASAFVDLDDRR